MRFFREGLNQGWARNLAALLGVLLLLLFLLVKKDVLITLPEPPAGEQTSGFDANRAAERLRRVLGDEAPHPVDSIASDAVRGRLLAEMRAVGLQPRVTDDFVCNGFARSRTIACARVRNLVATLGPADGRHLLLSAHYDSTFAGPGAADAGIGVATLLETAHLLRGRPLARPVTFLFNEGEEMGLLGARAFLGRDPVAPQVDTLINLEARGVEGPAIMFETSRPNAAALDAYSAVRRPFANSLTTDLYGLIPNSTDVAVFDSQRWTILNTAIIGNETRYHSAGDNLAALSRSSLQHMGDQTIDLVSRLDRVAPPGEAGQYLYMDLVGRQLITLPMLPGLGLLVVLLLILLVVAWRERALGRPLLAMASSLLAATALAWLGSALVSLVRTGDWWRGYPDVTNAAVYASALAGALLTFLFLARHGDRSRLRAAYWLFFLLSGAVLSVIASGAAIFFLLPPLAYLAGLLAARWWPAAETLGAAASALILFVTLGPTLALFEALLGNGPHYLFAPLAASLILPFMVEAIAVLRRVEPLLAVGAAFGLFLLGWLAVLLVPAYSEDGKQLFVIEYVQDGNRASWAVNNDGAPPPSIADWRRSKVEYSTRKRWLAPAPALALPAPSLEILAQEPAGEGRRITVRLRSNGAESVTLIAPSEAGLIEAGSGDFRGRFAEDAGAEPRYFLRCVGRSCSGATFDIVAATADPIQFTLIGTRPGLPPQAASLVAARPGTAQPQYSPDTSLTLSRAVVGSAVAPGQSGLSPPDAP